jgi:hypothetical protein
MKAASFALQWHLEEYPTGVLSGDFQTIVDRINNDELGEDIMPFECFRNQSGQDLAFSIFTMRNELFSTFKDLYELATK